MHMHLTEVWRVWRAMEFISPSSLFHVQSFLPVEVISYFLYHIIYPLPPISSLVVTFILMILQILDK